MTEDERLALIWEAAEALGDDPLLPGLLFALREPAFREQVRAFLATSDQARRALRPVLDARAGALGEAPANEDTP